MSGLKALHIPKDVLNLPCVRTARVYNRCGNLINIENVQAANDGFQTTYAIELMRDAHKSGPINVVELSKDALINIRQKNWHFGIGHYYSARQEQATPNLTYAFSILAGITSAGLVGYADMKATKLSYLPTCVNIVHESCNNKDIIKVQNELKQEFAVSGVGAAILAVVTVLGVRLARKQSQQPRNDFVRAALALGNVHACDKRLDEMETPEPK